MLFNKLGQRSYHFIQYLKVPLEIFAGEAGEDRYFEIKSDLDSARSCYFCYAVKVGLDSVDIILGTKPLRP